MSVIKLNISFDKKVLNLKSKSRSQGACVTHLIFSYDINTVITEDRMNKVVKTVSLKFIISRHFSKFKA